MGIAVVVFAIFALFALWGWKQGLIKIVVSIAAMVVTIIATAIIAPLISSAINEKTDWNDKISESVYQMISKNKNINDSFDIDEEDTYIERIEEVSEQQTGAIAGKIQMIGERVNMPQNVIDTITEISSAELIDEITAKGSATIKEIAMRAFAMRLADIILRAVVYSAMFIIIFVILKIVVSITGLIGMLPVIHQANQIGGLLCGLIEALIVVWVMFTVITALGGTTQMSQLIGQIHDNVVTDFIYNNNPIMKMLLKAVN